MWLCDDNKRITAIAKHPNIKELFRPDLLREISITADGNTNVIPTDTVIELTKMMMLMMTKLAGGVEQW